MGREITHFKKIDFLRGVAIISVFLYHTQIVVFYYKGAEYNKNGIIKLLNFKSAFLDFAPTSFGASGVELFLIISGFLIHFGFLSKGQQLNSGEFFSKRFWRIYPPYLVALVFFCLFSGNGIYYYLTTKNGLTDLLSHLLLIHNMDNKTFFTIDNSFWSLALEAQLYLIYPVLLLLRKMIGINKVFLFTLALSFVLLFIEMIIPGLSKKLNYDNSVFKLWFVWAGGAFLAEMFFRKERLFKKGGLWLPIILALLTTASKAYLFSSYFTLHLVTFAWLVFFEWFLLNEKINTNKRSFKVMSLIGICSYSIYLIHQPYLGDALNFFTFGHYGHFLFTLPFRMIITFGCIFLISYLLYLFVELPSIKLGFNLRNKMRRK